MSIKELLLRALVLGIVILAFWVIALLISSVLPQPKIEPVPVQLEFGPYTDIINRQNDVIEQLKVQVDSLNNELIQINEQKKKIQYEYKNSSVAAKPSDLSTLQGYFSKRYPEPPARHRTKGGK
ncbi:MAG TPA: hypothetical protein DCL77_08990 [Prolixibacteraceae bacterium]|jgi:hypothetical protein|nr:hypothetical protein [Prolixibacteraceae bacterium]